MSLSGEVDVPVTPTSPLFFVLVPRSGGATLGDILERQYGSGRTFKIDVRGTSQDTSETWRSVAAMSPAARRNLEVVHGHQHFGAHEKYFRDATYVTMFRDPVARIVSYYQHVLTTPTHYLHPLVALNRMRLLDFGASRVSAELDNCQTRYVSGQLSTPVGKCSQDMLEAAKSNLVTRFAGFGITERFDESVLLMRHAFGWSLPYHRNAAVSALRRQISSDVAEAIRAANPLDVALYEFAKERFNELVARQPATFRAELIALRSINQAIRRLDQIFRKTTRPGMG